MIEYNPDTMEAKNDFALAQHTKDGSHEVNIEVEMAVMYIYEDDTVFGEEELVSKTES